MYFMELFPSLVQVERINATGRPPVIFVC